MVCIFGCITMCMQVCVPGILAYLGCVCVCVCMCVCACMYSCELYVYVHVHNVCMCVCAGMVCLCVCVRASVCRKFCPVLYRNFKFPLG